MLQGLRRRGRRCAARSCATRLKTTGTKISVAIVAKIRPPTTARPSGAFCSPPSPSPSAIGAMPIIIASAVMTTGRNRTKPASSAAATGSPSSAKRSRAKLMTSTLLAVATPMHMIAPVRAGTDSVVLRDEQHPDDARQARRQRRNDDERIGPGLEIDDNQQIDQHDRAEQAEQQAGKGAVHRLHLAEQHDGAALGDARRRFPR